MAAIKRKTRKHTVPQNEFTNSHIGAIVTQKAHAFVALSFFLSLIFFPSVFLVVPTSAIIFDTL